MLSINTTKTKKLTNLEIKRNSTIIAQSVIKEFNDKNYFNNISIRSSPRISMPGILKTVLNVPMTVYDISKTYKDVYDSHFTRIADLYRKRNNIKFEEIDIEIIFQQMVNGKNKNSGSGIFYTKDPKNNDLPVYNFKWNSTGEEIVSGKTANDELPVNIYQKLINIGEKLESHFKYPQDIEFVIDNGELWILQTRNVIFEQKEKDYIVEGDIIANAINISNGIGCGILSEHNIEDDFILYSKELNVNESINFKNCKGIITKVGNRLCHAAILARKYGIPCLLGNVDNLIGQNVLINGKTGQIFKNENVKIIEL